MLNLFVLLIKIIWDIFGCWKSSWQERMRIDDDWWWYFIIYSLWVIRTMNTAKNTTKPLCRIISIVKIRFVVFWYYLYQGQVFTRGFKVILSKKLFRVVLYRHLEWNSKRSNPSVLITITIHLWNSKIFHSNGVSNLRPAQLTTCLMLWRTNDSRCKNAAKNNNIITIFESAEKCYS